MNTLRLDRITLTDFRSFARATLEPAPGLNVLCGNNGHGKSTLLEAVYFAATSRSFRTHRAADLVRHGATTASVAARFVEVPPEAPPIPREQVAAIQRTRTAVTLNGKRPTSLAEYATRSPVVAFHPEDLALSTGPASLRRLVLDRLALFIDPTSADHRARYARALRARQSILQAHLGATSESPELDAFEELCAIHGAALSCARAAATSALADALLPVFRNLAAPDLSLNVAFRAGGSTDVTASLQELRQQRPRDAHRPSPGFGPHRDDLDLRLGGYPARLVASQGQHRALTLAMKIAEAKAIGLARRLTPVLLFDDVLSELDEDRTHAVLSFLSSSSSQVFLTTTRRDLIVTPTLASPQRADFVLQTGTIVSAD